MKHSFQTNTIIPAISACRGKLSGGKKGGSSLQMCRGAVVCVQMWDQHWDPTLSNAAAFLMVHEKSAVRLCNQKKKKTIKIHSQSLIPLG